MTLDLLSLAGSHAVVRGGAGFLGSHQCDLLLIQDVEGNHPGVEFHPRPTDDPTQRRPDITVAKEILGWEPRVGLANGLERTLEWFRGR